MMGRAAPRRLCQLKSILVTLSPSSPMLDGSSRPALSFSSMVRPSANFQRRSSTGIGPVHEAQIYDRLPWGGGMMGSAAPDKQQLPKSSLVASITALMSLESVKPLLPERLTEQPFALSRPMARGSSPVCGEREREREREREK